MQTKSNKKRHSIKKREKDYETFIIENIDLISESCRWGDIVKIERQYVIPIDNGRIIADIMIWHKDGTGTCIEVKTGENNRNDYLTGISQLLFYGLITEHSLKNMPRLVLASPKIKNIAWDVVKKFNLPVNFLEVTENKCIYLSNGTK